MIRIANGQGFWGDWLEAPVRLVEQGPLDYLALDYLAEVTMSILQKQRQADPNLGYARDFPPLIQRIAAAIRDKHIKVIANAGGVNPTACAREVLRLAPNLKVAVVLGDDVLPRLDELLARYPMCDLDTGQPLTTIRDRILAANAYIGAFPIAEALDTGANVIITGRCTDPALTLAPMIHRFGWGPEDYDKLAAGTIAGHIIECGAQSTGGNCQVGWQSLPDLDNIGYPIVEAHADGTFAVTKHPGTGGRVHSDIVKEQLLYELGDPHRNYINPDCVADFTSIQLSDMAPDHVHVSGIRGSQRPKDIKLSVAYANGWKAIGTLVYSWPQALEKARLADTIVRKRLKSLGLEFEEIYSEFFGVNAVLGPAAPPSPTLPIPPEIQLRFGVRGQDRKSIDRFTREMIPLVLSGPPGGTGYGEGRPKVREVVSYWGALVPREEIQTRVELIS